VGPENLSVTERMQYNACDMDTSTKYRMQPPLQRRMSIVRGPKQTQLYAPPTTYQRMCENRYDWALQVGSRETRLIIANRRRTLRPAITWRRIFFPSSCRRARRCLL
jgi:hypothetical protein